ncbi:MAG: 30S ribosomal protein S3 [Eubacteriaceae bacterium]|nr:30S ribosomal protein S3 [Eubacteriaceae bacterium]
MGQKVSPNGLRVGIIKDWGSKWYADKNDFADYLVEDNAIREFVKKKLYAAGVSKIVIERRSNDKIRVVVLAGRPGMVIGRSGDGIEALKAQLVKLTGKSIDIKIESVKRAELDAQLTAESIAGALERRVSFRRAMKQAIGRTMKAGAKGVKVLASGRLGGAEIARNEKYSEGNVPLHTLRADIDYGFAEADTTYGKLGIKVWINHGEILDKGLQSVIKEEKDGGKRDGRRRNDRRNDRRPRNDRRRGRDDRNELPKAVNPRVRNTPKVDPAVEAEAKAKAEAEAKAAANAEAEAKAAEPEVKEEVKAETTSAEE